MLLCLSALAKRFSSREQESEARVSLCFHEYQELSGADFFLIGLADTMG